MLTPLFPRQADNAYRGSKAALWLLGLILLVKFVISVRVIFDGRAVAITADGIPLDTFAPSAAATVLALFAAWALAQLVIILLGMLVLIRYRTLVPLMLSVLLLEHLGRKLIFQFLPITRVGSPPGLYVNLGLVAAMAIGLALSLWSRVRGNVVPQQA